jgi:hypothetical protein
MTKIMFLAFWYSSIFPGSLLLCSLALFVNYYTDRFSLMRAWKRAPHVSAEISTYSRLCFFSTACIVLAATSSFYWAAFPFDNLCAAENTTLSDEYFGKHDFNETTQTNDESPTHVTLGETSTAYRFCNQDSILRSKGLDFPFMYKEGQ